jgi:hypothetical protein
LPTTRAIGAKYTIVGVSIVVIVALNRGNLHYHRLFWS